MSVTIADKATTIRIWAVFVDSSGAPITGLSPTLRIRRDSDGNYLDKDDISFNASPDDATMTEADATNSAGEYYYDFAIPDTLEEYTVRADGGSTAANRYQHGRLHADVTANAVLGNKSQQAIATGVVLIKDHDGTTTIHTMTPTVDSAVSPTTNILTPS